MKSTVLHHMSLNMSEKSETTTKTKITSPTNDASKGKERHNEYQQLKSAASGGIAAAVTRLTVQPLDVLKIRFQLQVEPIKHTGQSYSKYRSMYHAIQTITKEEGLRAFWKGHNPAQCLSILYGIVQFWGYEQIKAQAKYLNLYESHQHFSNFLSGGLAGALGTIVTTPLDVIRTRLIAQDNKRGYPNTWRAAMTIVQVEGFRGIYRGMMPAIMQVTPLTGINFMVYNIFCTSTIDFLKLDTKYELPAIISLANGAASGLISKSIVYPLDLTKKRLQIQGFAKYRTKYGTHFKCKGMLHCLIATVKDEGFLGLYKGMAPSIWKAGFTSAINFCVYDNIINLIKS